MSKSDAQTVGGAAGGLVLGVRGILLLGLLTGVPASGATLYVSVNGTNNTSDCSNPLNPCYTIQHAVDSADYGDTILVSPGHYSESIRIGKGLTLAGGGWSNTTITAGISGVRVIFINPRGAVTLRGITVRDGKSAGGILVVSSTPGDSDSDGLSDVDETSVHSSNPYNPDTDGGGTSDGRELFVDGTNPINPIDDLPVVDSDDDGISDAEEALDVGTDPFNPDTDGGGASDGREVFVDGTNPAEPADDSPLPVMEGVTGVVIDSCRIEGNEIQTATAGLANNGGGLACMPGTVVLVTNTVIRDNSAGEAGAGTGHGGGIFCGGEMSLVDCTVEQNSAGAGVAPQDPGGDGGGIYVGPWGALNLVRTTISRNSAGHGGPNSLQVYAAGVGGDGGGIYVEELGSVRVTNSTISGNSAGRPGSTGLPMPDGRGEGYCNFGQLSFSHCTVWNPRSSYPNPFGSWEGYGDVTIGHTVLLSSSNGTVSSLGFNLLRNTQDVARVQLANPGTDLLGLDPQLLPLGMNGGATPTHLPSVGSPLLGAGAAGFVAPPFSDQRGSPRVQNGRIDIGAVERLEPDADNDGMDGEWEFRSGLNPTNAADSALNPDLDPFDNLSEYIADTEPFSPTSYFPNIVITASTGETATLRIGSSSVERMYNVQWTTNLSPGPQQWYLSAPEMTGTGASVSFAVTNDAPGRVYRMGVRLP